MSKDNIIQLIQPTNVDDQLTEILRSGARALLAQAVEAEVADFLGKHADLKTADGHQRVVRHGHLPEREVMTGIGPVCSATIWMGTQRQSGWPFRRSRRDDDCHGATITQAIFA